MCLKTKHIQYLSSIFNRKSFILLIAFCFYRCQFVYNTQKSTISKDLKLHYIPLLLTSNNLTEQKSSKDRCHLVGQECFFFFSLGFSRSFELELNTRTYKYRPRQHGPPHLTFVLIRPVLCAVNDRYHEGLYLLADVASQAITHRDSYLYLQGY